MRTAYPAVDGFKAEDFQAVLPWALNAPGDAEPDTEPGLLCLLYRYGAKSKKCNEIVGFLPSRRPNFAEPGLNFGNRLQEKLTRRLRQTFRVIFELAEQSPFGFAAVQYASDRLPPSSNRAPS